MNSIVLNALNARPEEGGRVYTLLGQGFFTGIFLATFDVAAVTIFLQCFTEEILAWAFVASGAIGILFTYLYSYFQARVSFSTLVFGFLFLIAGATAVIWTGLSNYQILDASGNILCDTTNVGFRGFSFMAFVLALPFSYIGLLMFWGTFGRIFTIRQAKRLIGGIDTGQLLASITALFIIGALLDNKSIETTNLFLIGLISLGVLAVIFGYATIKFGLKKIEEARSQTLSIPVILKNKYLRLMALFVVVSMIAATFVDFSFLSVTQSQWTDPAALGGFIARFEAAVVIFSFLFQTFVTDYVIENYGLKLSLLVNPVLIVFLVLAAGATGLFVTYETGIPEKDFVWFFLAIAITKLFIDSLKDALDGPTFKLYFLPIDSAVRFDVTTKIEGVVTAFAGMIAGLILILMNKLDLSIIVVVGVLVPILVIWFFVTQRMHDNYRTTLQETLVDIRSQGQQTDKKGYQDEVTAEHARQDEASVYYSLKLMERLEPEMFEKSLRQLSGKIESKGRLGEFTKKKMAEVEPEMIKDLAKQAASDSSRGGTQSITDDDLYDLSHSSKIEDRIKATILLNTLISDNNVFVLLDLLRDMSPLVKKEALKTARKVRRPETWTLLTEILDSKDFGNEAAAALFASGDDVLPVLEHAFQKSDQSLDVQVQIVKIMSRLNSKQSLEYLWDKLEFPNRKIVREILTGLEATQYEVDESQEGRIIATLENEIGKTIWNLTSLSEIKDNEHNSFLIKALNEEVESNYEFIYIYLSILYDSGSIQLVKENIESGTSDGITYAIELLDVFVAKELKPKLFPLIDDIPLNEKLLKLQIFYPRVSYFELQTMNYIINRDFNLTNRWTKACALHSISYQDRAKINQGLIGQLFNPDPLLAEKAMLIIDKLDHEAYKKIILRLPDERRYYFQNIIRALNSKESGYAKYKLLFDRTLFLLGIDIFKDLNGVLVSQFVDRLQILKADSLQNFELSKVIGTSPLIFIESGKVELKSPDRAISLNDGDYFGGLFLHDQNLIDYTMTAVNDSVAYFLDMSDFLGVLTNWRDKAKSILAQIEDNDLIKV